MVNVGGCAAGDIQFLGPDLDRQFQRLRRLVQTMFARVGILGSGPKAEVSLPKLISATPSPHGARLFEVREPSPHPIALHRRHCGRSPIARLGRRAPSR